MISIIVSSADPQLLSALKTNLAETVGVPYELLSYDNVNGDQGICAIYNRGINDAKYDMLCFMHEDIILLTTDWGKIMLDIFNADPQLGLLGVAGSNYKALTPSGWLAQGTDPEYANLIQHFKRSDRGIVHHYVKPDDIELPQVACLDGLWFCAPKKVAEECRFDEDTFKGFHCYDIDLSLNVGQHYKVAVTYDILMEHLSEGAFDRGWIEDTLKLHRKWQKILPVNIRGYSKKEMIRIEFLTFQYFIGQLRTLGLPLSTAQKVLWGGGLWRLSPKLFYKMQKYLLFKAERKKHEPK